MVNWMHGEAVEHYLYFGFVLHIFNIYLIILSYLNVILSYKNTDIGVVKMQEKYIKQISFFPPNKF